MSTGLTVEVDRCGEEKLGFSKSCQYKWCFVVGCPIARRSIKSVWGLCLWSPKKEVISLTSSTLPLQRDCSPYSIPEDSAQELKSRKLGSRKMLLIFINT